MTDGNISIGLIITTIFSTILYVIAIGIASSSTLAPVERNLLVIGLIIGAIVISAGIGKFIKG